jgi:hypothetical protein
VPGRTDGVGGHPLGATIAGVLLFAIGVAIAAGTYESAWKERERRQQLLKAEGTVVAVVGGTNAGRPVVAFATASGERLSFTDRRSATYALGERVTVLYPPENPIAAIIDDGGGRAKTMLPTMAGLLVAVFGAYVAWAGRRSQLTFTEEP